MRALAALCVVLFHVTLMVAPASEALNRVFLNLGNIGVPLFFLISGFLLYRPFIAHRNGGAASPAVHDYARRRVLRIFPAFWAVFAVLALVPGISAYNGGTTIWETLLLHQLPLPGNSHCVVTLNSCGLVQTWSLTVELTFYAILPLYAIAAGALARRLDTKGWLRAEVLLLLSLSIASIVLAYFTVEPNQLSWAGGSVLGYAFWFALGMGLALASVARGDEGRLAQLARRHSIWLWLVAGALFVAFIVAIPPVTEPLSQAERAFSTVAVGVISLLLLVPALYTNAESAIGRFLSWRVCAWLGLISYGIFLWHVVVILKLGEAGMLDFIPLLLVTLAVTIALAAASYYLVERPALKLKYSSRREAAREPASPREPARLLNRRGRTSG